MTSYLNFDSTPRICHVTYVYCSVSERRLAHAIMTSKETDKTIMAKKCDGDKCNYNKSEARWAAEGQGKNSHIKESAIMQWDKKLNRLRSVEILKTFRGSIFIYEPVNCGEGRDCNQREREFKHILPQVLISRPYYLTYRLRSKMGFCDPVQLCIIYWLL